MFWVTGIDKGHFDKMDQLTNEIYLQIFIESNTIQFIHSTQKPVYRKAAYIHIVCEL